jgi:8-amino-3,8-dideoxy-alpha-D-manno-octulosonate transaminase
LVFFVSNNLIARRCRLELLEAGLATKILPEAYTWHFAGTWVHMPELIAAHGGNLENAFMQSQSILSCAVSLPVGVNMPNDAPGRTRMAIKKATKL